MIAATAAVALCSVGCASAPDRPERQLASAETGVEFAAENGATEYAGVALERARNHLAQAQRAADAGEYTAALRAAEKAEADAELAAAQTHRLKAEEALDEIRDNIGVLRREIARSAAG